MLIALIIKHKAQLLFHNTARFPRHNDGCNAITLRCSVGDPPGLICRRSARSVPMGYPPLPPISVSKYHVLIALRDGLPRKYLKRHIVACRYQRTNGLEAVVRDS